MRSDQLEKEVEGLVRLARGQEEEGLRLWRLYRDAFPPGYQDHYGVDLKSIEWWCQEEEDSPFEPAKWMNVKRVPHGKNVDQMLLNGELEAALYPETLPSIKNGSPKVALLFPEPKKAEIEYYRNGGHFPIMHTVVVKNHILEKNQ